MDGTAWAELALLGIVLTGLSGFVYMTAIRWVGATEAGILSYVEPVSAALLAVPPARRVPDGGGGRRRGADRRLRA